MNLYDVMLGSQGGQGVNTLANQFGISPQQTQTALQAMVPAFALGFQKTAADPLGFGTLMSQMANPAHAQTYANPAQAYAAPGLGGNVIGQIFGPQVASQISQQAAQASGVSAQVIQQMMPIVASMLIGGVANAMAAQGLGGLVGQLSNIFAANAGLAANVPSPASSPVLDPNAMLANWVNMMGSMMGAGGAAPLAAAPQANAMKAGLDALSNLMQAGVEISQAQQQGMNEILDSIGKSPKT